jgi:hypothetical protein
MASTPDDSPQVDYVFGYGSLVALTEPLLADGHVYPPVPGRLHGYRRSWGVAMNNWETMDTEKHFVDPESGLKPKIAVAYLDVEESPGATVNGLAIAVDAARLAELDVREVHYRRIDVSSAFRPAVIRPVFTYRGTDAARERSRHVEPAAEVFVSRQYIALIRDAFAALGPRELAEYERTTGPLRFPERDLELRYPPPPAEGVG